MLRRPSRSQLDRSSAASDVYKRQTISYSPELWDEMFKRLPYDNFGLNYDPSHLVWLGIDYIQGLKDYKDRIFEVHAKDTEVFHDKLKNYYSILGKQLGRKDNWDMGFWRHRMPGKGDVDWDKSVSYTHLRAHETKANLVCRLLLEKKK